MDVKRRREQLPTKRAIREYWAPFLVSCDKFISVPEVFEADVCFACGMIYRDRRDANTEKSHIIAHCESGPEETWNLHLLCKGCHRDSEHLKGMPYWLWFLNRNCADGILSNGMLNRRSRDVIREYLKDPLNFQKETP